MIQQTPWIERKFEFNFPAGLYPVIIERLVGAVIRTENMMDGISDEAGSQKINGAWSLKEHIGHLADLEELWYSRIEDYFAGKKILRAADMTNKKTNEANHNSKSTTELLLLFETARGRLLEKVEDIDEATASLTAIHPRLQKPMRLIDSLFFVAEHDDHHLAKMRALLDGIK